MLYVHVSKGIVARCKTVAEYEEWMDQREVWGRLRLRIIEEIEAFGIVHNQAIIDQQDLEVIMGCSGSGFTEIRDCWFQAQEDAAEGQIHVFKVKGEDNPADLMTKLFSSADIRKRLQPLNMDIEDSALGHLSFKEERIDNVHKK